MTNSQSRVIRPNQISYAVSVALAIMASNAAFAQQTPAPATPAADAEIQQVLVVGTRASQQSAIDRKKNAATAMDSIIAEDVGAFPDRNIGEAISRISGIALNRGDFGEGVDVSIRGNSADVTRVELDGQGVQSGGGTNLNGGGDGRGVELRELSSDLIKSVDVVKGSTPDMTEGSLGGSIIVKTRTGLDFKKPYYSLRLAGSQGSLNKKVSPDANLVLSNKFLDGRLGVLFNGSASKASNEAHQITAGGSNNQAGPIRAVDFDNSLEKTFSYNTDFLSKTDPLVGLPMQTAAQAPIYFAATPMDVVTKSAAAKTKADCYAAFPALTSTQTGSILAANGISQTNNRNNAIAQRTNELTSCLNQWNDYTPNLLRNFVKRQEEKRMSGDLRLDFKVNNNLSLYAKLSKNDRTVTDYNGNYNLGGISINPNTVSNPATGQTVVPFVDSASGVRTAVPGIGYYTYASTASFRNAPLTAAQGAVVNVDPASVVVDSKHNVTQFKFTNGVAGTDMTKGVIETGSEYWQTGGSYKNGGLKAEFFIGGARSEMTRIEKRMSFSQSYGEAVLNILPNGVWNYTFPAGSTFDQTDPNAYSKLNTQVASPVANPSATNPTGTPAYTAAQRPLVTNSTQLIMQNPRNIETEEKTAKFDLSYALSDRIPYFTTIKTGVNLRDTSNKSWGTGGGAIQDPRGTFGTAAYVPGIYIPTLNMRSNIQGCQDTPGSLGAGGQACDYGFNPRFTTNSREGTMIVKPEEYRNMIAQSLTVAPNSQFYAGAKDRPSSMTDGWTTIDIDKAFALSGVPNYNLDCIRECIGTDGKMYAQPFSSSNEKVSAGYFMTEFDIDHLPFMKQGLPFGMELNGNMGFRYVKTDVKATGFLGFNTIQTTDAYNPLTPNAAAGIISTFYRKNTTIASNTTDFMPIYNAALWLIPNQLVARYNHAKTIARPGISKLFPTGTCTYDERKLTDDGQQDADQSCGGSNPMGNPALKPQTNSNRNLSVEWYMNKDTMFTVAGFKQVGKIGAPTLVVTKTGQKVFAGSDAIDPVTQEPLADLTFSYNTWENQPATTRKGLEFGTKTALTFLPSYLKYTGFDANYTRVRSTSAGGSIRELINGEVMPIQNEPAYSYNASLWYDDGAWSARIALQVVAPVFQCLAPCSGNALNNFPAEGAVSVRVPYNPGSPIFTDSTRYLDAKLAYKFKNGIEIFVEGRNLGMSRKSMSTGGYNGFADGTGNLLSDSFNGRRIMAGITLRSM